MRVIKCDCNGCNNVSLKMNKVTVNNIDGSTRAYDVCDDCFNKIMNVINNVSIVDNTTIGQAVITDIKKDVEEKIVTQASSDSKEPKRLNVKELIESYGIEKLRNEYLVKNRSAKDIAIELGISKVTLAQYLAKLGISKRNPKSREHTTDCDKKEDN